MMERCRQHMTLTGNATVDTVGYIGTLCELGRASTM
jgi:hypothetical protein